MATYLGGSECEADPSRLTALYKYGVGRSLHSVNSPSGCDLDWSGARDPTALFSHISLHSPEIEQSKFTIVLELLSLFGCGLQAV